MEWYEAGGELGIVKGAEAMSCDILKIIVGHYDIMRWSHDTVDQILISTMYSWPGAVHPSFPSSMHTFNSHHFYTSWVI